MAASWQPCNVAWPKKYETYQKVTLIYVVSQHINTFVIICTQSMYYALGLETWYSYFPWKSLLKETEVAKYSIFKTSKKFGFYHFFFLKTPERKISGDKVGRFKCQGSFIIYCSKRCENGNFNFQQMNTFFLLLLYTIVSKEERKLCVFEYNNPYFISVLIMGLWEGTVSEHSP